MSSSIPYTRTAPRHALCFALALAGAAPAGAVTAAYNLTSGTVTQTGQTYTASAADTSAIGVSGSAKLTLATCTVSTTGNSSSSDNSSFYGLDAGILVSTGGTLTMTGGSAATTGSGANGIFAYGTGKGTLTGVTVHCTGNYAHGIMCSGGGSLTASDLVVSTAGTNSAAVATDRGGGTISVTGGTFTTSGADSPGIYSTGVITVSGGTYTAAGAEAAVIEGSNSVTLDNVTLTATRNWGVLLLQSMSGDASGVDPTYTQTGGSLTVQAGPAFYVANATGYISLQDVSLTVTDGMLVHAAANSRWGTSGSNGGIAKLTATAQVLTGDLYADSIASLSATLKSGSVLTGAATRSAVTIDATSAWHVTGASTLTSLTTAGSLVLTDSAAALTISGTASLGGTLTLASAPAAGSYTLITAGSRSGTFSALTLPSGVTGTLGYTSTSVVLTVSAVSAPSITSDPASLSVTEGGSATFDVVATGTAPLAYQWYKGTEAISGATSASYTIESATTSDAGSYRVVVSNGAGSATSADASLAVTTAYENFAVTHGLDPAEIGAPEADADADGLANVLEFVLLGDPTVDDAAALAPIASYSSEDGSGYLIISFLARTDLGSVTYAVEYSADLSTWTAAVNGTDGVTVTSVDQGDGTTMVTARVPSGEDRIFARLNVSP